MSKERKTRMRWSISVNDGNEGDWDAISNRSLAGLHVFFDHFARILGVQKEGMIRQSKSLG